MWPNLKYFILFSTDTVICINRASFIKIHNLFFSIFQTWPWKYAKVTHIQTKILTLTQGQPNLTVSEMRDMCPHDIDIKYQGPYVPEILWCTHRQTSIDPSIHTLSPTYYYHIWAFGTVKLSTPIRTFHKKPVRYFWSIIWLCRNFVMQTKWRPSKHTTQKQRPEHVEIRFGCTSTFLQRA